MSSTLRSHGKNTVVWILLAMLILGLGGFGVGNFSGGVGTIGSVGKTEIELNDYARALSAQIDAASAQAGRRITMPEALAAQMDKQVQAQLLGRAALEEQARIFGISAGDAQLQRQILAERAFHGLNGAFDRETYRLALRRQGLSESEYETKLRAEIARQLLQGAVMAGVKAPAAQTDAYTSFVTETRAISYAELTEADLTATLPEPDEATLRAHHQDNAAAFTRPETRDITYVWLTPEMLLGQVQVDEAALRAIYDERIAEFVQPERRLVERLVYPSAEEATAAKARVDGGTATFADLAKERGLTLDDADLGEVTREDLGTAADPVFALTEPGVVGPIDTDLGPALFSMNAVLAAQETTFEEAREDLASEAAIDRAQRMVLDMTGQLEDLLASGATLEQAADETALELGKVSFTANSDAGIAAYPAFREAAAKVAEKDFPELTNLEDGGVFALRLDAVKAPELIPFEEVRDQVAASWRTAELLRLKRARAEGIVAATSAGATLASQGLLVTTVGTLPRGGFLEGQPAALVQTAFDLAEGASGVVDAEGRVIVLHVDAVKPADPAAEDTKAVREIMARSIAQSLSGDLIEHYARAAQAEAGMTLDSAAANAVHAQIQ